MDCCALTLDFSFSRSNFKKSVFIWGDTSGAVYVIRFYDNPSLVLFSTSGPSSNNQITLANLLKGVHNLRITKFANVHSDWIGQLRYFSNPKVLVNLIKVNLIYCSVYTTGPRIFYFLLSTR